MDQHAAGAIFILTMTDAPHLFIAAPWQRADTVGVPSTSGGYLNVERLVPVGVSEREDLSYECRTRVAIPRWSLCVPGMRWCSGRWLLRIALVSDYMYREYMEHIEAKLEVMGRPRFPSAVNFDIWTFCSVFYVTYSMALFGVRGLVFVWTQFGVTADVHGDAVLWHQRLLATDYRTSKKVEVPFWSNTVRYERRGRS